MSRRCPKRDYVCRPPKDAQRQADMMVGPSIVWRLDPKTGRWAPDNGKPGLAFAAGCMHYYPDVECDCSWSDTCVQERSATKCLSQYSKCSPHSWARAMRELPAADDRAEAERLSDIAPTFYAAFKAGREALAGDKP